MEANTTQTTEKTNKFTNPTSAKIDNNEYIAKILYNDVADFHRFYNNFSASARLPEHDLLCSILKLSLYEYITLRKKYNEKNFQRKFGELHDWFFKPYMNKDYVFNFTNICDYLHLDRDTILKKLQRVTND